MCRLGYVLGPFLGILGLIVNKGVRVEISVECGWSPVHARRTLVKDQVSRLHRDVVVVARVVVDHQRPVFLDVLNRTKVSVGAEARRVRGGRGGGGALTPLAKERQNAADDSTRV